MSFRGASTQRMVFASRRLDFETVFIVGACRSGKTLLGNLLAASPRVEYLEEPWFLMMLPMAAGHGLVDGDLAGQMFNAYSASLLNDMVLLRQANFRPHDQSSIWTKKTKKEIHHRLHRLKNRSDVERYVRTKRPVLLCTLAEAQAFSRLLCNWAAAPGLIHVVRSGAAVASEIKNKKWLSESQLRKPQNAQIYRPYRRGTNVWYLPCWVEKGSERDFIEQNEDERALYYWCVQVEEGLRAFNALGPAKKIQVRYESFVSDPGRELRAIADLFKIPLNDRMRQAVRAVRADRLAFERPKRVGHELLSRSERLRRRLGYA